MALSDIPPMLFTVPLSQISITLKSILCLLVQRVDFHAGCEYRLILRFGSLVTLISSSGLGQLRGFQYSLLSGSCFLYAQYVSYSLIVGNFYHVNYAVKIT